MLLRRSIVATLIIALVSAITPAPSAAGTSTTQEVAIGQQTDKQITDSTNVVTDPLLNAWVNGVTDKLWAQVARKDVPYNIKILDVSDINAFSTLGGYVYVNEGLLDFVQSDDELGAVLGHETGHVERRHAITANTKANIVNILLGVGSLFSPFLYRFGQFIEAGALAKISRNDEFEADKYGLMLMSRAGYDPDAMVSMLGHLGAAVAEHNDLLDKYVADHPDVPARIARLDGYPELDPKVRTNDQRLAAALHDLDEARYAIAARNFTKILKLDPNDPVALYHLGEAQLALGQESKGEQSLTAAADRGTPQTRELALDRIHALRDTERRLSILHANLEPLREAVAASQARATTAATAIASRRHSGLDQIKLIDARIQDILYEVPPELSRITPRHGGRLETVLTNLTTMSRSLNTALDHARTTINGVGSLEHNKEGGLLKENADIYADMNAEIKLDSPSQEALATFAYYPRILKSLDDSSGDMVRAVDAARASMALLDVGLGDLDAFVRLLPRLSFDLSGEITPADYKNLQTTMKTAADALDKSALAATQASQLYYIARTRQLEARIDLLGLASSPDRYATLQKAINVRFKDSPMSYDELLHQDVSPGELVVASVIAADTGLSPAAVLQEAKTTGRSVVDVANAHAMHAEALEIMTGLIYLDYADDPDKEAHNVT
jgi:predicted Zn-dependent protease